MTRITLDDYYNNFAIKKPKKKYKYEEYNEQKKVFEWAANPLILYQHPELECLLYGNMNTQVLTSAVQQGRWKAAGGKAGIPDIFLAVARGGYHGLYIEMKKPSLKPVRPTSKGGVSDVQLKVIEQLREQGYRVAVCYFANEAINIIDKYLTD
jgi:hypothetical protein